MMHFDFSLKNGKITFNDMHLDCELMLSEQLDSLKEDMLQVEFPESFILDVGWYPSFEVNGNFQIRLIKDFSWDAPSYLGEARNIVDLYKEINQAISKIT